MFRVRRESKCCFMRGIFLRLISGHTKAELFGDAKNIIARNNELQMDQAPAGVPTAKPRKKYRDCNERIRSAVASYNAAQVLDFLTLIAHNYNF